MIARLADLRTQIATMDEAKAVHAEIAQTRISLAAADAKFEARLAKLKAEHLAAVKPDREFAMESERDLAAYIDGNREKFEAPRKVTTEWGTFGLQKVTSLSVDDERAMLAYLSRRKMDDCFKLSLRPVATAIRERIEAGETIPGCAIKTGDTAVCTVSKSLLDRATKTAVEGDGE